MLDLLDNKALDGPASQIEEAVARPGSLTIVQGPPGAGRSRMASVLAQRDPGRYVVVEAPDCSEPDAALHLALQAAARGRGSASQLLAAHASTDMRGLGAGVAATIDQHDKVLVLRLPSTWSRPPGHDERDVFGRHATALLRGLCDHATLRLVVLTTHCTEHLRRVLRGEVRRVVALPSPQIRGDALDDLSGWNEYQDAARCVRDLLRDAGPRPTAFMLGVAIAIQALRPRSPLRAADLSGDLDRLLRRLQQTLAQSEHAGLRDALRRIATARFPVHVDRAVAIGGLPPEHTPLVTRCVGYETADGRLRMTETIRAALRLDATASTTDEVAPTHHALGQYFESLDGVADPRRATGGTIVPWLEATHHFAWAGGADEEIWRTRVQAADRPELFWDRARALSIVARDWAKAAAVYRECAERFPGDHYSRHYFAWNLDRAGGDLREIETGYRGAVQLDPDNAWYNSRLVTFLIGVGRYDAAEQEWGHALDRLDPERTRGNDESLVEGVHLWVIRAWLDAGEVERARQVFDAIHEDAVRRIERLDELAWRLADAQEAVVLGTAVYPSGVHPSARWRRPSVVQTRVEGADLTAWYPLRIVDVDDDAISIEFATPEADPDAREVYGRELTRAQWREMSGGIDPDPQRKFWYLARYGERTRVFPNEPGPAPWQRRREALDPLRYLREWAPRR